MWTDEEKSYGELMSFLLQRRRHHGTDDRFRAYVAESVQRLARDLRDFGLEVSIVERQTPRVPARRPELNRVNAGCE